MRRESGQALLIVILILVIGLTIGLAVVSRSVTNLKISTQSEESQRAFSAAEAGLEAALIGGALEGGFPDIGATYNVTVVPAAGERFVFPQTTKKGETENLWLVDHDSNGNPLVDVAYYTAGTINVCWDKPAGTTTIPAMEVSVIYKDGTTFKVWRGAYDPDPGSRPQPQPNNFDIKVDKAGGYCGGGFTYRKTITLPSGIRIAIRLKPYYADAQIAAQGTGGAGANLPSQGKEITSTGTAGTTTRRVRIFQNFPALPTIFDYAVFSGTGLSK